MKLKIFIAWAIVAGLLFLYLAHLQFTTTSMGTEQYNPFHTGAVLTGLWLVAGAVGALLLWQKPEK